MTRIFILTLLPTQIIFSFLWCTDSPNAAFSHKREFLFEKKQPAQPLRKIVFQQVGNVKNKNKSF
jgi:hypothetical protein